MAKRANSHRAAPKRRSYLRTLIFVLLILEVLAIGLYATFFYIFSGDMANSSNADGATDTLNMSISDDASGNLLKTAKIATLDDIEIRSAVEPSDMTCVLFHQSSYEGTVPVKTELKEADVAAAFKKHKTKIDNDQSDVSGWANAEALHLYREGNTQPMNTAIDVGGRAGCDVYAPVTGTVVLVKKYKLYEKYIDYQIHIQPKEHPEYDCCILHCDKPSVKEGDNVRAGVTRIAKMRDIDSKLTGIQLADYTKAGGNHSHIQFGDANNADYRKRALKGAIKTS